MNATTTETTIRQGTPPSVSPLHIHPSVDPELARGLIAAVEHIADHPEEFDMSVGTPGRDKGCVICFAEKFSKWVRPKDETGFTEIDDGGVPLGDWSRIYCPVNWGGTNWSCNEGLFARVTHFLETGE